MNVRGGTLEAFLGLMLHHQAQGFEIAYSGEKT
jgi:hypothetical protein